jgi:hypothetical protein
MGRCRRLAIGATDQVRGASNPRRVSAQWNTAHGRSRQIPSPWQIIHLNVLKRRLYKVISFAPDRVKRTRVLQGGNSEYLTSSQKTRFQNKRHKSRKLRARSTERRRDKPHKQTTLTAWIQKYRIKYSISEQSFVSCTQKYSKYSSLKINTN